MASEAGEGATVSVLLGRFPPHPPDLLRSFGLPLRAGGEGKMRGCVCRGMPVIALVQVGNASPSLANARFTAGRVASRRACAVHCGNSPGMSKPSTGPRPHVQ